MAEIPEDAGFWLPSEFLPGENLYLEKKSLRDAAISPLTLKFPFEFPVEFDSFGSGSVISSPVESTASSSETESSDEEFLAALTQRLAQTALYETKIPAAPYISQNEHEKRNWIVSGSPQSTLTGVARLSGTGKVSGQGSPNGPSQFPSPPDTPFGTEKDAWDLIYVASRQVARLQTGFDSSQHSTNTFPPSRTYLSARCSSHLPCLKDPSSVSYLNPRLYQNPPQSAQFQSRLYDQVMKEECLLESRKMAAGSVLQHQRQPFASCGRTNAYEHLQSSVHHPWQKLGQGQQPQLKSSSFQASFGGRSCSQRESVGTGVFLPRRYSNPPEPRKQTGVPTVRPVKFQGNGLNYKDTTERSRGPSNSVSGRDYFAYSWEAPKYELSSQQKLAYGADAAQRKDVLLPMEWTY